MALWSYDELRLARDMNRRGDFPGTIARATGHTAKEVDLALWQLLGRTIPEACDAINYAQIDNITYLSGEGGGGVRSPAVAAE